ncbi:polysaccharide biosynthesis protein [Mangrovibacillus cuniculi]|uniref:Polysaccharide biosynthesis protein n=1 Tax=Mangrovibacillus cuniculi TaxID=2593652 RepID=A0A7S8CDN4_9BACI|nr:polysaccharide biosynthesis protein [Mangrovibacillus cuniculi]QPC47982.1 polysaccharide biosynthesis protein [Mangrovibacillus cuniculi]
MQQKAPSLIKGTLLLTLAAFIVKVLSASYRIPFQNMVGDVGYYVYQQVYPFFALSIALYTYGYPVLLSKWIHENNHYPAKLQQQRLTEALLAMTLFSLSSFFIIFGFSNQISYWMGDLQLAPMIQLTAVSFLLIPIVSLYRGVYQSQGEMTPTALSQVIEQGIRVVLILVSTVWLMERQASAYEIGYGAYIGTFLGGLIGLAFLVLTGKGVMRTILEHGISIHPRRMVRFLLQGAGIAVGAMISVLLQLIDALTVIPSLLDAGVAPEMAKEAKGIYDRGWPLLQFGLILSSSIALALIPAVMILRKGKKIQKAQFIASQAIRWSILVSLPASVGLVVTATDVNIMLFKDSAGTDTLRWFSWTILFASTTMVLIALYQTIASLYKSLLYVAVALLLKALLNIYLIPIYGMNGIVYSQLISLGLLGILFWIRCSNFLKLRPFTMRQFLGLCFSIIGMVAVISMIDNWKELLLLNNPRIGATVLGLFKVFAGGVTYVLLCFITRTIKWQEWKELRTFS